jgi:hypothetical protein
MTMGMSIEPGLLAPQLNISSRISDFEFNLSAKSHAPAISLASSADPHVLLPLGWVYSRFLHTITAPAVMEIITTSSTISGQLMLITPAEKQRRLGYSYILHRVVLFLAAAIL